MTVDSSEGSSEETDELVSAYPLLVLSTCDRGARARLSSLAYQQIHLGMLMAFGTSLTSDGLLVEPCRRSSKGADGFIWEHRWLSGHQFTSVILEASMEITTVHFVHASMGPSDPARQAVAICRVHQHGGDGLAWPSSTLSFYLHSQFFQSTPAWRSWAHLAQLDMQSLFAEHAIMAEMGQLGPDQHAVTICRARQHGGVGPAWPSSTHSRYLQSTPAWQNWARLAQLKQLLFAEHASMAEMGPLGPA